MKTYALGSTSLVNTPGILRWAMNGYHFPKDRASLLGVFTNGFPGPNAPDAATFDRLLKGEIKYIIEESDFGGTVVFEA